MYVLWIDNLEMSIYQFKMNMRMKKINFQLEYRNVRLVYCEKLSFVTDLLDVVNGGLR